MKIFNWWGTYGIENPYLPREYKETVTNLQILYDQIAELEAEIADTRQDIDALTFESGVRNTRATIASGVIDGLNDRLDDLEVEYDDYEYEVNWNGNDEYISDLLSTENDIKNIKQQITEKEYEYDDIKQDEYAIDAQIRNLQSLLKEREIELRDLKHEYSDLTRFEDDGGPAHPNGVK